MTKRPTNHKDIAEYVNIAQSTVSRALDPSKSHLISGVTRTKIINAAEKLGFRANIYAQRMRKLKTDTITLIIDGQQLYSSAYLDFHAHHETLTWDLICGVISYCAEHNFDVKLLPLLTREDSEIQELSKHIGYPYSDGVIFLGYRYLEKAHKVVSEQKIPAVIMSSLSSQIENEVSVDPTPGIQQAIRCLVNKGHRKIAFCQLIQNSKLKFIDSRRKVYEAEMKELGLFDPKLIYWASDERGIKELVANKKVVDSFTALLCINDPMADRWIRELNYASISVPEDKAVIGFDNNPAYPTLSTVDVPRKEVGWKAAQVLIESIKNKKLYNKNVVKESKFILRNSC
jgi:LacI family transcriptional regulator, repressor for deo operon, udp, cdd, tsx, nupC, and nupG